MSIDPFATYQPTDRAYTSGDFQVVSHRFNSGWVSKNKFSTREMGRKLQLTYKLYDYQAINFYQHYNEHKGTAKRFELPQTFKGVFYDWAGTDLNGDETKRRTFKRQPFWHYAEPITQTTIANGVSQLTVVLVQSETKDSTTPPWVGVWP